MTAGEDNDGMLEYDPAIAARFRDLETLAQQAVADPNGQTVTALGAAYEELMRDSGLAEEMERQRRMRAFHPGRGRAVDIIPPKLTDWMYATAMWHDRASTR